MKNFDEMSDEEVIDGMYELAQGSTMKTLFSDYALSMKDDGDDPEVTRLRALFWAKVMALSVSAGNEFTRFLVYADKHVRMKDYGDRSQEEKP